jgi:transcription initiation factor TFIIB
MAEKTRCVECGGPFVLDPESGEQICRVCGVVGTVWDAPLYQLDSNGLERGPEPTSNLAYDIQLHTLIGNTDAKGKSTFANQDYKHLRMVNLFTITHDSRIDNGMRAMAEINQITGKLGLSGSVEKEAQEIYRKGLKTGIISGKSISNMSAAAVLLACKLVGASCSPEEIERMMATMRAKTIRRYYRLLVRELGAKFDRSDFSAHIVRIAGRAGLSVRAEKRALEILALAKSNPAITDKRSSSVAAAALYIAAQDVHEYTSQLRIAVAGGATPITIRKRSAELRQIIGSRSLEAAPVADAVQVLAD